MHTLNIAFFIILSNITCSFFQICISNLQTWYTVMLCDILDYYIIQSDPLHKYSIVTAMRVHKIVQSISSIVQVLRKFSHISVQLSENHGYANYSHSNIDGLGAYRIYIFGLFKYTESTNGCETYAFEAHTVRQGKTSISVILLARFHPGHKVPSNIKYHLRSLPLL